MRKALKQSLTNFTVPINRQTKMTIPPGTMTDLLEQNFFQFTDQMYHQVQGTAMGTKMAPSYANIFIEEKLLTKLPKKPLTVEKIHRRHPVYLARPTIGTGTIYEIPQPVPSHNQIYLRKLYQHLDLTIYKGERCRTSQIIDLKPFFKPTNKFQYLIYTSAHGAVPLHTHRHM